MEVRPVLMAAEPVLAAVEVRDAGFTAALAQLSEWDRQGLVVPRIVVGVDAAPDPAQVESELSAFRVSGARLALALAEGGIDATGMRRALDAIRGRTGAVAVIADFGSGARPDVEFLVDYPADFLALSPRLTAQVAEREEVAGRVKETCAVTGGLGWRVIAPDVVSPAEREALAAAGVAEVTGPAVAPFAPPAELSGLLSGLGVAIPAAPQPSGRAPAQSRPPAPTTKAAATRDGPAAPAAAVATAPAAVGARSPFRHDAPPEKPASRLSRPSDERPAATSISTALPEPRRGSPGRSQPFRGEQEAGRRRRGRGARGFLILLSLLLLAAAVYAVLAYLGHVPDPLGIEDIEL